MTAPAYEIHLDLFEGPLDLLLYLIKKSDLEITEIPIARITAEYLSYLDVMKDLNLEIAGDFLVMASTLMQIKARMLLPSPEAEAEDGPDPLEELKARLIEYQKFKEVAQTLSARELDSSQVYYRHAPRFEAEDLTIESSLFELIDAFKHVLDEMPTNVREIVYQEIPIEQKIREVLGLLEGKQYVPFLEIMRLQPSRHELIVCFMAVLELIRLKQVVARQSDQDGDIRVYRVQAPQPAEPPAARELFVAQEQTSSVDVSGAPAAVPAAGSVSAHAPAPVAGNGAEPTNEDMAHG